MKNKIGIGTSALLLLAAVSSTAEAEVRLPKIFGDHMVLQREQSNPIWGQASPGESVRVSIDAQLHETVADADGNWRVELTALTAGGPHTLRVVGENTIEFKDVLVGEVWVCSGQSNMELSTRVIVNGHVELATADFPEIRLISVPRNGHPEPQDDFNGKWKICSAGTAKDFSAVGFLYGRRLHLALGVSVGLIDNSFGGSSAEAWIEREVLELAGRYERALSFWDRRCEAYSDEVHEKRLAEFRAWKKNAPPGVWKPTPKDPRFWNQRPGNLYNGHVRPILGYGIRGVIWYQGEANAVKPDRAYEYRETFPLLIESWRDAWGQGDFPFYWAQLADYRKESYYQSESLWAILRESQTEALTLPNTGQAVIIDAGEGRDIHPRDKQTVANRLARHALAKDYGIEMPCESPRFQSMEVEDGRAKLVFEHSGMSLYAQDKREVSGFSIAGADQVFYPAVCKITSKDTVEVSSEEVTEPVAVRYAWADNPIFNLYSKNRLPVTPFRTDHWSVSE